MRNLLLLLIMVPFFSFGQKLKDLIKDGKALYDEGDYYSAQLYFKKALQKDSSQLNLQYLYAECARLNQDFKSAEYWYAKVIKNDKKNEYKESSFWLASVKKQNGNYKEAKKLFEKYAKKYKRKGTYLALKAEQEAKACDKARLLLTDTLPIRIIHLDSAVNSVHAEIAPFEINEKLYFSSLRYPKNQNLRTDPAYTRLFLSDTGKNSFLEAQPLVLNNAKEETHYSNLVYMPEKKLAIFSGCQTENNGTYNCKIYSAKLENNQLSEAQELPEIINAKGSNNTQPALGYLKGEPHLFFSSDREGGKGKMDIWYAKIDTSTFSFYAPINAGPEVNTADDEVTPYYCNPCQALYFSSTWHEGLGGFDVFKSLYQDKGFTKPQNAGYPINSAYNDLYFKGNKKGNHYYLVSNRKGSYFEKNETCCNDIYQFKIDVPDTIKQEVPLKDSSVVFVKQAKLLVPLTLYFHNDEPDNKTTATTTKQNYESTFNQYIKLLDVYKKEYAKGLSGIDQSHAERMTEEFFEDSVVAGMNELAQFARLLEKIMLEGKTVEITMKGFCSPLASTNYNIHLAKRRISSLQNYFRQYKNGLLLPYIEGKSDNGGRINFKEEDIGELQAKANTSDNPNDVKNSIYSINAASERKIQIIAFELAP